MIPPSTTTALYIINNIYFKYNTWKLPLIIYETNIIHKETLFILEVENIKMRYMFSMTEDSWLFTSSNKMCLDAVEQG